MKEFVVMVNGGSEGWHIAEQRDTFDGACEAWHESMRKYGGAETVLFKTCEVVYVSQLEKSEREP